jgi:tRNA (cytidine32/uridine32-2'-O)-methyltransferase
MPESRTTPAFGDLHSAIGPEIVVVLVEPSDARNIGAVARAMSNLSVHELRLVQAAEFDTVLAEGVACWGREVISHSKRFSSLNDAVADCHEVVGFASDSGRHRVPQLLLDDWALNLERARQHKVALVFGSEENGLRRQHFPLCQYLIRIPSNEENRSYNLAQSVLLALYAIRARVGAHVGATQPDWPVSSQLEPFTKMVLKVAEGVGFLNEHSPAHIQDLLINLTRRGRVTTRELKILTGLMGMIDRVVARGADENSVKHPK